MPGHLHVGSRRGSPRCIDRDHLRRREERRGDHGDCVEDVIRLRARRMLESGIPAEVIRRRLGCLHDEGWLPDTDLDDVLGEWAHDGLPPN